jgi:hypothetical protein
LREAESLYDDDDDDDVMLARAAAWRSTFS